MSTTHILPGRPWLDTLGNPISAGGGGFLHHGGWTWWYGESHAHGSGNAAGIACYRSRDLVNWEPRGLAMPAGAFPERFRATGVAERPKVLFHAGSGRFVMWMHLDADGYTAACAGVAVADAPDGPFRFVRAFRPLHAPEPLPTRPALRENEDGACFRDMTLFRDDDGTAYVFYSAEDNASLYAARLSADYLDIERPAVRGSTWERVLPRGYREAPAVFRHAGSCYMITSGLTGWAPNPAQWHRAPHPLGPWESFDNPCRGPEADTTFRSQSTFVLPAPGAPAGSFLYCGDRWVGDNLAATTSVWLPFRIGADGAVRLRWADAWNLDAFAPRAAAPARVSGVRHEPAADGPGVLVWEPVPGVSCYDIFRNGEPVGNVAAARFPLPPFSPGTAHAWSVRAWTLDGPDAPLSGPCVVPSPVPARVWLDELEIAAWSQGYGSPGRRCNLLGGPLEIGGAVHPRGLATHVVGRLVFRLGGAYARLRCGVGMLDSHAGGVADFRVYGDGRLLHATGPVGNGPVRQLEIALRGVHELELVAADAGRGPHNGHAVWADACVER
jgi:hypothetical protein